MLLIVVAIVLQLPVIVDAEWQVSCAFVYVDTCPLIKSEATYSQQDASCVNDM
jgi:hypothetical protein